MSRINVHPLLQGRLKPPFTPQALRLQQRLHDMSDHIKRLEAVQQDATEDKADLAFLQEEMGQLERDLVTVGGSPWQGWRHY